MNQVTTNFKQAKAVKDPEYIGYVKQLPCAICEAFGYPNGQAPSDAHHTVCGRFSGIRTPDANAIPLCKPHHQTGQFGKHAIHNGKETWVKSYGKDTDYIDTTRDRVFHQFSYVPKGFE